MLENAGFNPARQFLRALWDYRNLWLIPTALCTILAVGFAIFGAKSYSARQTLVIRDDLAGEAFKPGTFGSMEALKSAQETILEIARRPQVIRKTLEQLGPPSTFSSKDWVDDAVIESTQGKINISAPNGATLGETEAIVLSVTASSKQRVARFIELLLDEVEKNSREFRAHRFKSMEEELQQSAIVARRGYEVSANKLEKFEKQFQMDLGTLRSINDSQSSRNALGEALAEMKREAREAQKSVSQVKKQMEVLRQAQHDPTVLVSAPPQDLLELQPALGGLAKGLNEALLRQSTNLGKYSRAHPLVISNDREINDIKNQIINELENSLSSLNSQLSLRVQNHDSLATRIADHESRLMNLSGNRVNYKKLTDDEGKKRESLGKAESMLSNIQSLGTAAHSVDLLTRIDKPQISNNPIGPTKKTIVFGGMLAGLLIGMGLVMFFAPIDIGELPIMNQMAAQTHQMAAARPVQTAPTANFQSAPAAPVQRQDTAPEKAPSIFSGATTAASTTAGALATEPAADQFARALAKSIAEIATNAQAAAAERKSVVDTYASHATAEPAPTAVQSATQTPATAVETPFELPKTQTPEEIKHDQVEANNLAFETDSAFASIADTSSPTEPQPTTSAPTTPVDPAFEKPVEIPTAVQATTDQTATTFDKPVSTSSVFDKLLNQLETAKTTGPTSASGLTSEPEPAIDPDATKGWNSTLGTTAGVTAASTAGAAALGAASSALGAASTFGADGATSAEESVKADTSAVESITQSAFESLTPQQLGQPEAAEPASAEPALAEPVPMTPQQPTVQPELPTFGATPQTPEETQPEPAADSTAGDAAFGATSSALGAASTFGASAEESVKADTSAVESITQSAFESLTPQQLGQPEATESAPAEPAEPALAEPVPMAPQQPTVQPELPTFGATPQTPEETQPEPAAEQKTAPSEKTSIEQTESSHSNLDSLFRELEATKESSKIKHAAPSVPTPPEPAVPKPTPTETAPAGSNFAEHETAASAESTILAGLGLGSSEVKTDDELERALERIKNERRKPLTESRIAQKTDTFPNVESDSVESETVKSETSAERETPTQFESNDSQSTTPVEKTVAESKPIESKPKTTRPKAPTMDINGIHESASQKKRQPAPTVNIQELADAAPISTRPKSETVSFATKTPEKPDSPREKQSTADLLEARRKAKSEAAGGKAKPVRKKAKTIDLRELKTQLSSENRDGAVGDQQLGQNVANAIMGVETDDVSTDLTDQISKLTASIDEFVNDNDGDNEKS